jgi:FixJ family two-component response regulator
MSDEEASRRREPAAGKLFASAEAFTNHSDFDGAVCVLLDINLGDVSGIELRNRLKTANISVPIIYMTRKSALGQWHWPK